ncbi:MAG: ABC transporter permease, partial [bacterium]
QNREAAHNALWPDDYREFDDPQSDLADYFSNDLGRAWSAWIDDGQVEKRQRAWNNMQRVLTHHGALSQALAQPRISLQVQDKVNWEAETEIAQASENLFDYFLPGMAVFFLMFGVAAGIRDLHREMVQRTFQRQLLTPALSQEILRGKWGSAAIFGALQLFFLFGTGAIIFGVNLGPDPFALPAITLLCCLAGSSVFLFLAVICPSEKVMDTVSTIFILASAMIGGNFLPVEQMPLFLQRLGSVTFNYWANSAFNQVIAHDAGLSAVTTPLLILLGFATLFLMASLISYRIRSRRGGLA